MLRLKERYGLLDAAAQATPPPDAAPRVGREADAALARRMMEGPSGGSTLVRRLAGVCVGLLGVYFIARPFLES